MEGLGIKLDYFWDARERWLTIIVSSLIRVQVAVMFRVPSLSRLCSRVTFYLDQGRVETDFFSFLVPIMYSAPDDLWKADQRLESA